MNKCLVIGLDGATWEVIKPFVDSGKMPTLKKLMETGSWGELQSTIPPLTGPAWVSFATGRNPGKTGVFDFMNKKKGSYDVEPITSHDFKGIAIWDHLTQFGKRTFIVNYPMLFPPYPLNGVMISGLAVPDREITFPPELRKEIDKITGGYEITIPIIDEKYNDVELFLKDLYRVFEKRAEVVYYLLKDDRWDLFLAIFSATDWIQHVMWKRIDESHPLHNPKTAESYKAEFSRFWEKVDQVIEKIVELAGRKTNIIIVSDHGFGPQYGTFNLNSWLEKKGYTYRKKNSSIPATSAKKKLRPILARWGRKDIARFIPRKVKNRFLDSFLNIETEQIDFEKSVAYTCKHTVSMGNIYLNVKDREPNGILEVGEYTRIKNDIIRDLKNLKNDIGEDIEVEIFNPKDIYWGQFVHRAPDIIFTLDGWRCVVTGDFGNKLYEKKSFSPRHNGNHRLNGIFLASGPNFKNKGKIENLKIYDIAPTIIYLLGFPIPKDMDGRVLKEIINKKEN